MKKILIASIFISCIATSHAQVGNFLKDPKGLIDALKQPQPQPATTGQALKEPINLQSNPSQKIQNQDKKLNHAEVIDKIIRVAALNENSDYTGNDWSKLNELFGNNKFKNISDREFTDAKSWQVTVGNSTYDIAAKGARSMIFLAVASVDSPAGDFNEFSKFLSTAKNTKKICVVDDSASFAERYYEYRNLTKPIIIKYQFSAGSGGATESITVGIKELPKECGASSASGKSVPLKVQNAPLAKKIGFPINLHGRYFERSKKECIDEQAGFESLLTIEYERISFGNISSCEPRIVNQEGVNYIIKAACASEGEKNEATLKIIKTNDGVTVNKTNYKRC